MKRFKRLYIEITNICNLNCSFCPPTLREKRFMSVVEFRSVLSKIDKFTAYLYFHVKGEPLLHPELGQLLDICKESGFKVNITTNGSNIRDVKELLLTKTSVRQVSFSLQSIETYSSNETKEEYLKEVLDFVKEAIEKTNMIIELRLWNINQRDELNKQSNSRILRIIEEELKISCILEEGINSAKGLKISNRIYLSQSQTFEWPNIDIDIISTSGFCYGLRNQIGILVDGTVIPCCLDSDGVINLGNIFEKSLDEILESKRAKDIFNGFSNRRAIEPLCQRCGYRERFDH